MKLLFIIGNIWFIGFVILTFLAFSRFIFDRPVDAHEGRFGRFGLFVARVSVSFMWPFALMAGGGRRTISYIMKGE